MEQSTEKKESTKKKKTRKTTNTLKKLIESKNSFVKDWAILAIKYELNPTDICVYNRIYGGCKLIGDKKMPDEKNSYYIKTFKLRNTSHFDIWEYTELIGISENTFKRSVKKLEDKGLIMIRNVYKSNFMQTANEILISEWNPEKRQCEFDEETKMLFVEAKRQGIFTALLMNKGGKDIDRELGILGYTTEKEKEAIKKDFCKPFSRSKLVKYSLSPLNERLLNREMDKKKKI